MKHSEEWEAVEEIIQEEKHKEDWHIERGLCPVCATAFNIWDEVYEQETGRSAYDVFCPRCGWECRIYEKDES